MQAWRGTSCRRLFFAAAALLGLVVGSVPAAAVASPVPATAPAVGTRPAMIRALETAWAGAAGRHLGTADVAGVRPGSLRTATLPSGARWAMATFVPSSRAGSRISTAFQDGAATGLFTRRGGSPWRLVAAGPEQGTCHDAVPAAVRRLWRMGDRQACATSAGMNRVATQARSALPSSGGVGNTIARIALGQVGVSDTPASDSFANDCDPYTTLVGPKIPNSDGCGVDGRFSVVNENEAWCSDFAKWAWQRAGVTSHMGLINAGSDSFYAWAKAQGEALPIDPRTPHVGDAVVFFPPGTVSATAYADHVGIVTAVHPNGTVDLVDGDFAGSSTIGVEYDTNIDLATWSSQVWSPGEQWVFVAPPAGHQQPAPVVSAAGPRVAVAGTAATFSGAASERGGSVTKWLWTFGDGGAATTRKATHVFGGLGPHTVTLTATSNRHTVATRTWDLDVVGASSPVTSEPSTAVWYSTTPLQQQVFSRAGDGSLAEERSDGADWTRAGLPATVAPGSSPTAVEEPTADGTPQTRVFSEASSGALALTTATGSAWTTTPIPGLAAPGRDLAVTTVPEAAHVAPGANLAVTDHLYFVKPGGHLAEASPRAGSWTDTTLPLPRTPHAALAAAESTGAGPAIRRGGPNRVIEHLFYVDGHGTLVAATGGARWRSTSIAGAHPRPSTPLAAVATARGGGVAVFFVDRRGRLARATLGTGGTVWNVQALPGAPQPIGGLAATDALLASGTVRQEVAFVDASGHPHLVSNAGAGWSETTLPGTATAVTAIAAFPEYVAPGEVGVAGPTEGAEQRLYLADGSAVEVDGTAVGGSGWTTSTLPGTATTVAGAVTLYAATPADVTAASQAAAAAGLSPAQVTGSFATAWDDTLSGDHLVIAVGQAATNALYSNSCGWTNPSGAIPGSTPFGDTAGPLDQLPAADVYENGAAATASATPQLAADLAWYAGHGALPSGQTALPAPAAPSFICLGTPTGSAS